MMPRSSLALLALFLFTAARVFGVLADAGHRPFHAHVPNQNGTADPRRMFREPYVEVSPGTEITVYTVVKKFNNAFGTANQTGGTLYFKGASAAVWQTVALEFHANEGDFQYWRARFTPSAIGAAEVIQYYFRLNFDSGSETTFLYAPPGFGDLSSQVTSDENAARLSPFTIRNRPAWIFHANNRVVNGDDVQFWAKVGYIFDGEDLATGCANTGALYFTTNGDAPAGSLGTVPQGSSTTVVPFTYDHPEQNREDNPSITGGKGMWWKAEAAALLANVPFGSTVRYKIGFWHTATGEEKFADHNAGTDASTFTFNNGLAGDPALTVSTPNTGVLNGNYTTSKLFVDEIAGSSVPMTVTFAPGEPATEVEVVTNLNQRSLADNDTNGNAIDDGMEPYVDATPTIVGAGADFYYRSYPMTAAAAGSYTAVINASRTGAYRLTARWKVAGDPAWRWFTNLNANRRDHAITVSPTDARDITLYEINTLTTEGKATGDFIERSTFEDLYDDTRNSGGEVPAPRTGDGRGFNLDYFKALGVNWLWFQPVHPPGIEGRETDPATSALYNPGSPYAVKNFFEINPWMSAEYTGGEDISSASARTKARHSFRDFVAAADAKKVEVMLDAPFNHTSKDSELAQIGVELFQPDGQTWSAADEIKNREARFFSRSNDYAQRASGSGNIAVAPDRGDFGKWNDVVDVYFGRYSALVNLNPNDNGSYLNERDEFLYADPNWISADFVKGGMPQNVTRNVWKYFANYALHWLTETGYGPGTNGLDPANRNKGIDGLRCDFGQGLPPQCWEYIINVARERKWNFVMMSESLDGGAVTYRSNRHFDILNENIVFPFQAASTTNAYRGIFDGRRSAYGQGLVLLNNTSHDEENYPDFWEAVVRYTVAGTIDGLPMIFMGQELGVNRESGFQFYETNFGKKIAHFKKFNSMQPAWEKRQTNAFGEDFVFDVLSGVGQARRFSPALRSSNRYYLNQTGSGVHEQLWSVAKYEQAGAAPGVSDVVFAFANLAKSSGTAGNFNVNINGSGGGNLFGINAARTYNVRNIAAFTKFQSGRRGDWLWGAGRSGSDVLTNGVFVAFNALPGNNAGWQTAPFEAQYLKLYDVTPPPVAGAPGTPKAYSLNNAAAFSWSAASDPEGGISGYHVVISTGPNGTGSVLFDQTITQTSQTVSGTAGQTLYASVKSVNNAGVESTSASTSAGGIILLEPAGDHDGDGMTNSDEDFAGTSPLAGADRFHVSSVASDGDEITVTWTSIPGKSYRVEAKTSLVTGDWDPIGSVVTAVAGETAKSYSEPVGGGAKYYRVRVLP